jgi:hypothetical protein
LKKQLGYKQTNKQRGRQDCKEHDLRKDGEAEGKKTRVADNYRILENTTTTKKKQECVQNPAPPFINSQSNEYLRKPVPQQRQEKIKRRRTQIKSSSTKKN